MIVFTLDAFFFFPIQMKEKSIIKKNKSDLFEEISISIYYAANL